MAAGCGDETEPSTADRYAQKAEDEAEKRPASSSAEAKPIQAEKVEPTAGEADLDTKPKIPKASGARAEGARRPGPHRRQRGRGEVR